MAKKNSHYISIKESRALLKYNIKQMKYYEGLKKRKLEPHEYQSTMIDENNIIEIDNLETSFFTDNGTVKSVNGVSFNIPKGKIIGVVGESGCGKSVTSLSIMQLVQASQGQIVGGEIRFNSDDLGYDENGVSRGRKLTGPNVNSVDLIWGSLNAISKPLLKTTMRIAVNDIFERKLTVTNTNGTNSDDIEYSYAEDSIYSYVNLCNHSGEEKSIKVLYDSEILSASTDLISGRNFDSGSLKLAPYETSLLRTENRKISAKIEKDAQSQTNVYKATFDVKRSTSNEEVLLIFASYEANGQLSEVKTVKADFSAQSDKSYTISLGIKSEERLICMAVNAATLVPYIDLLELKPELNLN